MSFILRTLGMGGSNNSTASPTSSSATNKRKSLPASQPAADNQPTAETPKPLQYKITKEQFDQFITSKTGEFIDSKMKECLLAVAENLPMEPFHFLRQFWETQLKQHSQSFSSSTSSIQAPEVSSPKPQPTYLDLKDEALELQKQLLEWNVLNKKLEEEETPNLISKLEAERNNATLRSPATEQQLLLDQSHLQELDLQTDSLEQEYLSLQKSNHHATIETALQEWRSLNDLFANGSALESQIQQFSLLQQLQSQLKEEEEDLEHELIQLKKLSLM